MHFGFELEGFYRVANLVTLPPRYYPTDGFPGLCEVRTVGGQYLEAAYYALLNQFRQHPFDFNTYEYTFSPKEKQILRRRWNEKEAVSINNIYGKAPRALGNKTIASFQISLSRPTRKGLNDRQEYGIFDFVPMIERLDETFAKEIADSKRQPGWYAVKDDRVEYRSLPNFVFTEDREGITKLLDKISKAVNN